MVDAVGVEPTQLSPLVYRQLSSPHGWWASSNGAGYENRTHIFGLEVRHNSLYTKPAKFNLIFKEHGIKSLKRKNPSLGRVRLLIYVYTV